MPEHRREFRSVVALGFAGSLLLLLGGLIIETMPGGAARSMVMGLQRLGTQPVGHACGALAVLCGLVLLTWSWVRLVVMLPHHGRPGLILKFRRAGGSTPLSKDGRTGSTDDDRADLRFVRRVTALWSAPLCLAPPMLSHDGWAYVGQGLLTASGMSPYSHGPGDRPGPVMRFIDPSWRFTPTPYGPLALIWGGLCGLFTDHPFLLVLLQRVPVIVGLCLTAWAIPKLARLCGTDAVRASALALASPVMIAHGVGGMHNDVLIMGLAVAGLALAGEGRWMTGAALVGLAAAVKFTAIAGEVPVALVSLAAAPALSRRVIRLAQAGAIGAVVVAATGIPFGLGLGWIRALSVPGAIISPTSIPTVDGMVCERILTWFGVPNANDAVPVARSLGMVLAVILVLALALSRPCGDIRSASATMMAAYTAIIVMSPVVHAWYFLVLAPFAAVLLQGSRGMRLALTVGGLLGLAAPLDSSVSGATPFYVVILMLAGFVVANFFVSQNSSAVPHSRRARSRG